MSSEELSGDSSDSSPKSVNFGYENLKSFQIPGKPKSTERKYMSWTFHNTIQVDVLACEFEESKWMLIGHFRTRTTHDQPICVRSVTIFADLKHLILSQAFENPAVSIATIGYVKKKPSRQFTMTKWIQSATWFRTQNQFLKRNLAFDFNTAERGQSVSNSRQFVSKISMIS